MIFDHSTHQTFTNESNIECFVWKHKNWIFNEHLYNVVLVVISIARNKTSFEIYLGVSRNLFFKIIIIWYSFDLWPYYCVIKMQISLIFHTYVIVLVCVIYFLCIFKLWSAKPHTMKMSDISVCQKTTVWPKTNTIKWHIHFEFHLSGHNSSTNWDLLYMCVTSCWSISWLLCAKFLIILNMCPTNKTIILDWLFH